VITPHQLIWYLNDDDKLQHIDELVDLLELGLVRFVLTSNGFQLLRTPAGDAVFSRLSHLAGTLK
jgi:hypothetical protein